MQLSFFLQHCNLNDRANVTWHRKLSLPNVTWFLRFKTKMNWNCLIGGAGRVWGMYESNPFKKLFLNNHICFYRAPLATSLWSDHTQRCSCHAKWTRFGLFDFMCTIRIQHIDNVCPATNEFPNDHEKRNRRCSKFNTQVVSFQNCLKIK